MKNKLLAIVIALSMTMGAVPVMAATTEEQGEQQLTNVQSAGDTAVEAEIGSGDGSVSYIISIPEKIDFGTLVMPESDEEAHMKTVGFEVSAVEINGIDTQSQRVAVLMRDSAAQQGIFKISGTSGTNMDKVLTYSVLNSQGVDITSGREYANGYAFAAFSVAGQTVNGTLNLEQNQLLTDTEIANWAGDYLGNINFYTAIADLSDY